jgi:signal transduction histidine kinase
MPPLGTGLVAGFLILITTLQGRSRSSRLARTLLLTLALCAVTWLLVAAANFLLPLATLATTLLVTATVAELRHAGVTQRRSLDAAARMESGLGISAGADDVGPRLDAIAESLVTRKTEEAEAKRMLAHELKTPLASMRGLTQLLSEFHLSDAERQRVSQLLAQEAGKLEEMVGSLLDLERVTTREFDREAKPVDLTRLVDDRVTFLQASTDRVLQTAIADGMIVRGDAALLERVIDNLAGNAMKYSPAGEPVTVRVQRDVGHVQLEVEDRGAGVSPAERDRIFSRFVRGSSAAGTQGLGLGLAMVSEIVRWHRGTIDVRDAASRGAIFRVTLPAMETHR